MLERGWHPDPRGDGERWYDGTRWTGVTRHTAHSAVLAAKAQQVAARHQPQARRGRRVRSISVASLVLILTLGLTILIHPDQVKPIAVAIGFDRPQRLLPAIHPTTDSSHFAILNSDKDGDPVTYDPCKPLHYVINPSGAPADYRAFIDPAIKKAQAGSGLRFAYDGLSNETWSKHSRATKVEPVLLSFPDSLDSPRTDDDAVGLGGSSFMEPTGSSTRAHYVTGQVALLRNWFRDESARHATQAEESVVMHELGHVIGLGHVRDPDEVMFAKAHGQTSYGEGDLAGLAKLGDGRCD